MTFWQKLHEKGKIVGLSPMDGVTDGPFRYMVAKYGITRNCGNCSEFGMDSTGKPENCDHGVNVIFTEFVSVDALKHAKEEKSVDRLMKAFIRAQDLGELKSMPFEIAQVFGSEPELFYQAAVIIATLGFDGMDINMGCPAKSVSENGCGAGLIRTPETAIKIIEQAKKGMKDFAGGKVMIEDLDISQKVKEWVKSHSRSGKIGELHSGSVTIPISIKTRLGVSDKSEMEEWISRIMEAKPEVLSLHGRTLKQLYSGEADWQAIGRAAEIVHKAGGLILGNGDIKSIIDLEMKIKEFKVDGGLLGRAAEGNPGIFRGNIEPSKEQRIEWMLEHANIYEKVYGQEWFIPMRKHLAWYTHGFPGAVELRQRLMKASSATEVVNILSKNN